MRAPNTGTDPAIAEVILYHERTKHHFHRYARSAGFLDWASQPDPFRSYGGVIALRLPLAQADPAGDHTALCERGRNVFQSFTRDSVGVFLELSLGLSAWKSMGENTWALRMNPSSGNLHPTEAHLILPELPGFPAGVFHYNSYPHALEQRAEIPEPLSRQIKGHFQTDGFLVALTSVFWRESWKYGERAFRYCQHDVGHALAALSFSANLLGWKVTWLDAVSDAATATLCGLDQTRWPEFEAEHPELLCYVHRGGAPLIPRGVPREIVAEFSRLGFHGTPNRLSEDHVDWEIISRVAEASAMTRNGETALPVPGQPGVTRSKFLGTAESKFSAAQIIRQRRSAVAFDGATGITKDQFFAILDKTLPRADCAPFDSGLNLPRAHLLLFVHRVSGLTPGLYFLPRAERDLPALREKLHRHFLWQPAGETLPLYLLEPGDFQGAAISLSCQQSIAGDSAFSLGMIARFREELEEEPCRYRHSFWEAGMIGQVLYLEAESQGVRATGIGCFFDDPVHELMGLQDNTFQSLYHFTVGGPREDGRLGARAPYHHLEPANR
jgi:SagB-type dehydrogenase family enzyme